MKTLRLTLKKKWFDMILSGEKKEEYREIKPYWGNRLFKGYFAVEFVNGYGSDRPRFTVFLNGVSQGFGYDFWGAPLGERVYILYLGDIISHKNIK